VDIAAPIVLTSANTLRQLSCQQPGVAYVTIERGFNATSPGRIKHNLLRRYRDQRQVAIDGVSDFEIRNPSPNRGEEAGYFM